MTADTRSTRTPPLAGAAVAVVLILVLVLMLFVVARTKRDGVAVRKPDPPPAPDVDTAPRRSPYVAPIGRSPIPQPGENIRTPLAPRRLQTPETANGDRGPGPQPPASSVVPWIQAGQHVGRLITTEGRIVATNNIGHLCFLNFTADWQDRFYVVMFADAFAAIPEPPETHYLKKTIRVTGVVSLHKGRPQIQVRDAGQIRIMEMAQ